MKPLVDKEHSIIEDYYNFDNIDIDNIRHKIKIYECLNIGISYGQFLNSIKNDMDFDFYIFTEDDYVPFIDYFEKILINEYLSINLDIFLCLQFIKGKKIT